MWMCHYCGSRNDDSDSFCIECGLPKLKPSDNHCSNPDCKAYKVILPNPTQKYCGKCGAATTYWKKVEEQS